MIFLINVANPTVIQMSRVTIIKMVLRSLHIIQIEYEHKLSFPLNFLIHSGEKNVSSKNLRNAPDIEEAILITIHTFQLPFILRSSFDINANSASFQLYAKLKWEPLFLALTTKSEKRMCTV